MVIVVEIEDHGGVKPFLGGWRNVITCLEYHNACTQTHPRELKISHDRRRCGVSQTITIAHKCTITFRDKVTYVSHIPALWDKFLITRDCVSHGQTNRSVTKPPTCAFEETSAKKIQRLYRAHRDCLTQHQELLLEKEQNRQVLSIAVQETLLSPNNFSPEFDVISGEAPRTKSDFEMLRSLLDRWRILEEERLRRSLFEESRVARRYLLLSKEIKILREIDTLKTRVALENRERRRAEALSRASRSVTWKDDRGRLIYMDTLQVQKAAWYGQLYRSLLVERVSIFVRRELLAVLKRVTSGHSCRLSRELSYLIDQELRLLSCDVNATMLHQLRNRLRLAYLRLMENVIGNDNFLSQEKESPKFHGSKFTKYCKSCNRLLDLDHFSTGQGSRITFCNSCLYLCPPYVMYEPYKRILHDLRRREEEKGCRGLISVVNPKVIYHLVNNIWHGRSGLAECDDLERLRLVRFQLDVDWSPWNTLLLTEEEAALHEIIADPLDVYDSSLVQKFRRRNLQARLYFKSITKLPKQRSEMSETGNQKLHRNENQK